MKTIFAAIAVLLGSMMAIPAQAAPVSLAPAAIVDGAGVTTSQAENVTWRRKRIYRGHRWGFRPYVRPYFAYRYGYRPVRKYRDCWWRHGRRICVWRYSR